MRKRNFWMKCLAFMLVVVMVLSEQNITTLGETIGDYTQERMAASSEKKSKNIAPENHSKETPEETGSSDETSGETPANQNNSQENQKKQQNNSEQGNVTDNQGTGTSAGQTSLDKNTSSGDDANNQNQIESSANINENKTENKNDAGKDKADKKDDADQKKKEDNAGDDQDAGNKQQEKQAEQQSAPAPNLSNNTGAQPTQSAPKKDKKQKKADAKAGDDTQGAESKDIETYLQAAERHYGKNGTMETATVSIRQNNDKNTVMAGDTIPFTIDYMLRAAAYYNYGEKTEPLFDTYDNTKIILHLPEGLSIDTDTSDGLNNVVDRIEEPEKDSQGTPVNNDWTLHLSEKIAAASDKPGSFKLNLKVEGNGSLAANHVFDFMNVTNAEGEKVAPVEIQTSFTIRDRTGAGGEEPVYNVSKGTESELQSVTTTTDDSWKIAKRATTAVVNPDKTKVTVTFALSIGLDNGAGGVVSNPETYDRVGRVPFARKITLTETPSVNDRNGNEINAESITIIPDFDKGNPISAQTGQPVQIPVNTCANAKKTDGSALSNVASTAPYYSTYTVEIVYPYEKFIAHYADEKQGLLTVNNTAKINYQLAGEEPEAASATAYKEAGEITAPAKLIIGKNILSYDAGDNSEGKPYTWGNFGKGNLVSGPVSFKITGKDDTIPKLYTYNTEKKKYEELVNANGIITYNPSEDKDNTTGQIEVFLDAGDYTVSELVDDEHPQIAHTKKLTKDDNDTYNAEDKTVTATTSDTSPDPIIFYNQETLGEIIINKTGQGISSSNGALGGAVFGLYTSDDFNADSKVDEVTTNEQGQAKFTRLAYGKYWVKEISAPAGYIIDSTAHSAIISATSYSVTVNSVNKFNLAPVQLQKQIVNVSAAGGSDRYINVGPAYQAEFNEKFEIQEEIAPDKWERVNNTEALSLGANGATSTLALPVYRVAGDGTQTAINYRFKETLPEGWHAINDEDEKTENGVKVVYSEKFTLVDKLGAANSDPKVITMKNDRNGSIDLTKDFYKASNGKMVKVTAEQGLTATFKVYYKDSESGTLTEYEVDNQPVEYTLTPGQTVTIKDLPRTGANGVDRYYYLVETAVSDPSYISSDKSLEGINGAKKGTETIGEQSYDVYGPFNFTEPMKSDSDEVTLKQSVIINNVKQEYPVIIKKVNSYNTDEFVSGASYGIYEQGSDGTVAEGTSPVVSGTIPNSNGAFTTLTPGKIYEVKETVTPAGYNNISTSDELKIDLTNQKVDVDTTAKTITIKNKPDPTLTITKKIIGADGKETTPQQTVTFGVYTKNEDDSFEAVKGYDGTTNVTLTSGVKCQLPAGEYYLKEEVLGENPNQILDPSKYSDIYEGSSSASNGIVCNGEFYFGPFDVEEDPEGKTQLDNTGTIVNYSDKGAVTITKYRRGVPTESQNEGSKSPLAGAKIGIFTKNAENELVPVTGVESQLSDKNGKVTFSGLPIYMVDANGQPEKIKYYIQEIEAPDNYIKSEDILEVELEAGTTVTKDTSQKALELINLPETSLTVEKTYYNKWEYTFTNKAYLLQGAEIALYKKTDANTYTFVETGYTDEQGRITFNGLTQKDEYVAFEVDVPDGEAYQYLEPVDGTHYLRLKRNADGTLPQTIAASELKDYYHVTKEANGDALRPQGAQERDMVNVENWAQLQIWKYDLTKTQNTPEKPEETEGCKAVNNAQFTLYMEVLPEDTANNTVLSYDPSNPDKVYTEIGTYSSGTLYDTDGKRMDGWFGTDILKAADNVVYWLVETDGGIGANIRDENVVTLIRSAGTGYTNNTTYTYTEDGKTHTRVNAINVMDYQDNQVTKETLRNDDVTGPGSAMFSTVRIAKWAGARDKENGEKVEDFTPLGNATFDLYLADAEGNLYNKLDTLTTGLDNNISESSATEGLSAWASSKAFSWTDIEAYRDDVPKSVFIDGPEEPSGERDHYVRVAIRESSAPTGYQMDVTNTYYMYMFFEDGGENTTTEIFNDAYYVKGDGETADQNVTLADEANKNGIKWALYPTKENQDGTYSEIAPTLPTDISSAPYQYRLVNWPIDTQAVTVRTYGYEVQNDNQNMTSEELNTYYNAGTHQDREDISVSMKLEYYDTQSKAWVPYADASSESNDGTFTTGSNGYYVFPNGLRMGQYRLTETSVPNPYENIYDGKAFANGEQVKAYYFRVDADNLDLQLYNPEKLSMSIKKTGLGNSTETPLNGVRFTLTNKDANTNVPQNTNAGGVVEFNNIGTGHYLLEETTPATGYTNSYFAKYIQTKYNSIASIVDTNGEGLFLGYETAQEEGANGTSVIVTNKTDLAFYNITSQDTIDLNITNPQKVSFDIQKQDADDNNTMLPGAEFKVEYMSFNEMEGTVEVNSSGSWTNKGTVTTKDGNNGTTRGVATFKDGDPGIYRIKETRAPGGYDLTDTTWKYIAMTGGLPITKVKVDGKEIKINDDAEMVFKDDIQVSLHVTKIINKGNMDIDGNHSFTFALYQDINGEKQHFKDLTISTEDGANKNGFFTGLSQGETYYLKETDIPTGFAFESLKKDGESEPLTPKDGYYEITMPEDGTDVSVTVTNTYLYAQTTIMKVDGEEGTPLTGAGFAVYRVKNEGTPSEKEVLLTSNEATVTPAEKDGFYTVKVLLKGKGEETFRIKETKEPFNYLKDTSSYIEFTIGNGVVQGEPIWSSSYANNDDLMLTHRIFPNYNGAYIDIVKYDDRHDVPSAALYEGKDAVFTLYKYVEGQGWTNGTEMTTDEEGKIHFVVEGGAKYALRETTVPGGYQGLDSIWTDPKTGEGTSVEVQPTTDDGTVYYVINGNEVVKAGQTYSYKAYNTPYLPLEIQKHNSTDPTEQLTATAAVYEIPEGTALSNDSTNEAILAFIDKHEPIEGLGNIPVTTKRQENREIYSYADGSTTNGTLDNKIVSGKNYLVVETSANDSLIRDNKQVQWFDVIKPDAAKGTKQVASLYNVVGDITLNMTKTAANPEDSSSSAGTSVQYDSLYISGAEVEYTLTPTVSNTYPLDKFVVTDGGLTAYNKEGSTITELAGYLNDAYSLSEVEVGPSSHNIDSYAATGADETITATVVFKDGDGHNIGAPVVLNDVSSQSATATLQQATATLPDDQRDVKAAKVEITYSCAGMNGTDYALGTNFQPGPVKIQAEIDQQQGGADKKDIDYITNKAHSTLGYSEWTSNGEKKVASDRTANAETNIFFDDLKGAKVSVTKSIENNRQSVALLDTLVYNITVSNDDEAEAAMQNPYIVDYLPPGTTWVNYEEESDNTTDVSKIVNLIKEDNVDITCDLNGINSQTKDGETAVFIHLDGELNPGESTTIQLRVRVENTAAFFGQSIDNYVLVGSDVDGIKREDNPQGASFMNANGQWAEDIDKVLGTMQLRDGRLDTLKGILGTSSAADGFVADSASVNWRSSSVLTLDKSAYGDRNADDGYTTGNLSTVDNGGTMYYRLSVSNTSANNVATNFSVIDILPNKEDVTPVGAVRDSFWGLNFNDISRVYIQRADGTQTTVNPANYTLYCYTGQLDTSADYLTLYNQTKSFKKDMAAEELANLSGWSVYGNTTNKNDIKAFIVATDNTVEVGQNETLVVEYTAKVNGGTPWEEVKLNQNAYENAVNSFACTYGQYDKDDASKTVTQYDIVGSNMVSATVLPGQVKVGGHVWIDKNNNGVRDTGESMDNFRGNTLIEKLLDNLGLTLSTYSGTNPAATKSETFKFSSETQMTKENPAYFEFDELDPAARKENISDNLLYEGNVLQPKQLKGSAPATYILNATLPDDNVAGQYEVAETVITPVRKSWNPADEANFPEGEKTDNNFAGTEGSKTATSERFYLWATDPSIIDKTKDLGLVPYRDLTITKQASDNQDEIEGATFIVYGPFAEDTKIDDINVQTLKNAGHITKKTDENGKAVFEKLLRFQKYVIVEESPATGYDLDSAEAEGDTNTTLSNKFTVDTTGVDSEDKAAFENKPMWLLGVPDAESTDDMDEVTVTNERTAVDTTLEAAKTYFKEDGNNTPLSGTFKVSLWKDYPGNVDSATEQKAQPISTKDITVTNGNGEVSFDFDTDKIEELSFTSEGDYEFYITEALPAEATEENSYTVGGIAYDPTIYKATVKVEWKPGKGLVIDEQTGVTYEKLGTTPQTVDEPTFTNTYSATSSWTPAGTKTLTGRDMKDGETYNFTVTQTGVRDISAAGTGTGAGTDSGSQQGTGTGDDAEAIVYDGTATANGTVTAGTQVNIDFDPISYTLADADKIYTYEIRENVTGITPDEEGVYKKDGVIYDTTVYTVEVTVTDKGDGTLNVTSEYYDENDKMVTPASADFTNNYIPESVTYNPTVKKTLTGNKLPDEEKSFTFTLKADSGNPTGGATLPSEGQITISFANKEDGRKVEEKSFNDITFTKGGTYKFTVEETQGNETGYKYDSTIWTVTVTVVDDGKGRLSINLDKDVSYTYMNDQGATVTAADKKASFTNDYTPVAANTQLTIYKEVSGNAMKDAQTFTFTQSLLSASPQDGVTMPLAENCRETITVQPANASVASKNTATFDTITFTKEGTYYFKIEEETSNLPTGYSKEIPSTKLVKVVVDDQGGRLVATQTYYTTDEETEGNTSPDQEILFTNEYKPTEASFTPLVKKTLTGDDPSTIMNFTFKLSQSTVQEGVEMPSVTEFNIPFSKAGGTVSTVSFPEAIKFKQAGEYTFTISEEVPVSAVNNVDKGYTYDDSDCTLIVTVTDKGGYLEASGTYKKDNAKVPVASFENDYDLEPTDFAPAVTKTIEGAAVPDDIETTFTFELTNVGKPDGVDLKKDATKTLEVSTKDMKNGSINAEFADRLHFTKAGTYTFQIAETAGNQNGYTYDGSIWNLTVTVEDKGGYLEVTDKTYVKANVTEGQNNGENKDQATFTNTYSVTPAAFTPKVEKTFSADSVDRPTAKDFTFTLTADKSNPEGGAFTGVTNGASGTALTVDNTLTAIAHGEETVDFSTITFKKAGTYKFQIQEKSGTDLGYTYDNAVWTLTVPVVDKGGELVVEGATYRRNNDTVDKTDDAAVFENTYSYVASIKINKEVLRGNAEYDTDNTFYAGIFRRTEDADGTPTGYEIVDEVRVDNKTVEDGVIKLTNNGTVEVYVPLGGAEQTEAVTYYVFETDADGHPLVSFDADGNTVYNEPLAYEITSESSDENGVNSQGAVYVEANEHPTVTITNRATDVTIEKTDMDGNPLSGATLELWKQADSVDAGVAADADRTKDEDGNVLLETWVSDDAPHVLTAELAVGGSYFLRETGVPAGYVQAADILFTVEDGEPITVTMVDEAQAGVLGQVEVTKRLSYIDETTFESVDLIAADTTVYVGLFTDPEGEHPYGDDYIRPIRIQEASSGTAVWDDLPTGTYYVFETLEDGTVIPYGSQQSTEAGGTGTYACVGDGVAGGAKVLSLDIDANILEGTTVLNNTYYDTLPDGYSYQGEIMLTKSIIKDGAPADSSDTFYAGVFTSETETVPYKVVELKNNDTVSVEVPLGGETGMDAITYYIYETDANGNKVDKNTFAYTVSGEGTVALDMDNTVGSRTIINTIPSDPEETVTISPDEPASRKKTTTKKTTTVKTDKDKGQDRKSSSSRTGDDNRVGLYILFFAAAVAGVVISLRRRGKHTEDQ